MTTLQAAYRRAYEAYRQTGLTKIEFYRTRLSHFLPEGRFPGENTFYKHFRNIEIELEHAAALQNEHAKAAEPAAEQTISTEAEGQSLVETRQVSTNIRFAEVSEAQIEEAFAAAEDVQFLRQPAVNRIRARRLNEPTGFRMRLPNGTSVEFEASSPELLAVEMMLAASGGAR